MSINIQKKIMMKVTLMTADKNYKVTVEDDIAFQSNLLKKMITDSTSSPALREPFLVSQVNKWSLKKIIEWCTKHRQDVYKPKKAHENQNIQLTKWDEDYLDITTDQLYDLSNAACYLDVPGLIDIIAQKVADSLNGKTIEEMCEICGFRENHFTLEEKQ